MRSRVMPGSSPTIERRLLVIRLNSVLLPTLGRPTIATSGSAAAPAEAGTTDLRYVGKTRLPPLVYKGPHIHRIENQFNFRVKALLLSNSKCEPRWIFAMV